MLTRVSVTGADRMKEIVWRRRTVHPAPRVAPLLFFLFDDADDLVVPALNRNRLSRGRFAVGIDAFARAGTVRHEESHHVG